MKNRWQVRNSKSILIDILYIPNCLNSADSFFDNFIRIFALIRDFMPEIHRSIFLAKGVCQTTSEKESYIDAHIHFEFLPTTPAKPRQIEETFSILGVFSIALHFL